MFVGFSYKNLVKSNKNLGTTSKNYQTHPSTETSRVLYFSRLYYCSIKYSRKIEGNLRKRTVWVHGPGPVSLHRNF